MRIVELKTENVKRIQAVEITPQGNVVVIGGKNGAGKSSVLDSIEYALHGGDDTVIGGAGDDVLIGGNHADTFVFEGAFGHDTIAELRGDTIDLSAMRAFNGGGRIAMGDLLLTAEGSDVRVELDFDNDGSADSVDYDADGAADTVSILIEGITVGALSAGDFVM